MMTDKSIHHMLFGPFLHYYIVSNKRGAPFINFTEKCTLTRSLLQSPRFPIFQKKQISTPYPGISELGNQCSHQNYNSTHCCY